MKFFDQSSNYDGYNAHYKKDDKKYIIMTALKQAKYIVVFNNFLLNKVISLGINSEKIKLIKQSIEGPMLSNFNLRKKINMNPSSSHIFFKTINLHRIHKCIEINRPFSFT